MAATEYFRGGSSLVPKRRDLRFDPKTGDVLTEHGVSVSSDPAGLDRFGGAHRVLDVPPELKIIQRGRDPNHYEIVPGRPMPFADYLESLRRVRLTPA